MSDQPDSLVLILLRRIDQKMDDVRADVRELKERVGRLEEIASSISRRIDRTGDHIDRIERRLDISEAPASPH
jgi:antitoxin component HigA of HigAB toxin-antitoxin module